MGFIALKENERGLSVGLGLRSVRKGAERWWRGAATPIHRVLRGKGLARSRKGIVRTSIEIKRWIARLPEVDRVRPAQCPACGAPSRVPGRPLGIHGHGAVRRDLWGPFEPGETPVFHEVLIRRFRCLSCRTIIRVGPREVVHCRRYNAGAIAVALALWGLFHQAPQLVRETVSPWRHIAEETKRRWASLPRWTKAACAGHLWSQPRRPISACFL